MKKICSVCVLVLLITAGMGLEAKDTSNKVTYVRRTGYVTVTSDKNIKDPLFTGMHLRPGDTIKVGSGGACEIKLDGKIYYIKENTEFKIPYPEKDNKEKVGFFGMVWDKMNPDKDKPKHSNAIAGTSDRAGRQPGPNRPIQTVPAKHPDSGNNSASGGVPDHIRKMDFMERD